jgi:predicted AlkP superfamily phosphohydrolase/phosphomutase
VLSSALVVLTAMLSAILTLFTWPVRWVIRSIRGRRAFARARVKRVVILGLDGLEPTLLDKYMAEGRLPHFAKLAERGCYKRLRTVLPPLSPVAWSSFLTGSNPGKHNIFDFLTRDPRTYMPLLSSVHIGPPRRTLKVGKYLIPIGKPDLRLMRKGVPFWKTLGDHGIFSSILRVHLTFPPERFRGVLVSGMCVPDLRGSQGMFSYYTTRRSGNGSSTGDEHIGGEQIKVEKNGQVIQSHLVGPPNTFVEGAGNMTAPFTVTLNGHPGEALLQINGERIPLKRGQYTDWTRVVFKPGLGVKVHGICQFLLLNTSPEFELYVTPIHIDPEKPALPITFPRVFSTYLAKAQGLFATLGLAEDTWAHNERILTDPGFLHQCTEADHEREAMFMDSLKKVRRGLVAVVFDGSDRIQHMFWRYIDPKHPAREGFGEERLRDAIPKMYARMDALVGRTMAKCNDRDTVLMVCSDHGFKSFRRGMDLNRWLIDNGYMKLKPDGLGKKYLQGVDWSQTRAFAIGLAGIYLNVKDRESQGIVEPGAEADALRAELADRLTGLKDPQDGAVAINHAYVAPKTYRGPYKDQAPDLIVGWSEGYRVSWEAAVGEVTDKVFHDNTKAWSGDHCIDPVLVPGILLCNRPIEDESPRLMDLGPTTLDLFGVDVPAHMDGKPLTVGAAKGDGGP